MYLFTTSSRGPRTTSIPIFFAYTTKGSSKISLLVANIIDDLILVFLKRLTTFNKSGFPINGESTLPGNLLELIRH